MRLLSFVCTVSLAWGADASTGQIRNAASKGVALIQLSQKAWYSKQSCYSCHQQSLPALAFRDARERGIPVNEDLARADAARTFAVFADLDRAVQGTHLIDPALSEGYLLLAAAAAGVRPNVVTADYARLIASRQMPDGHWETIDVRPPQSYSTVTATSVALRVLQIYGHPKLAVETRSRIDHARAWLEARNTTVNEERAAQLFGLMAAGADRALVNRLASALKAAQQPDGGWNSREGLASDAYSTGETLVVLAQSGVPASDPAWLRGVDFLVNTQAADGSWHVVSRLRPPAPVSPPYFETGYPYGHDQFISAMGAAWAVRALSAALPAKKVETPPVREAVPSVAPWVETAIFGSAAELKALLDKGLDPNSTTPSGTTLLMMAQPDLEKTKLLLERGADVNARAKTRYSALMIAAEYRGSAPVVNYLLDHKAAVTMPKGSGAPLFGASPLELAGFSGNGEIIPRLAKGGDNPDGIMLVLGTFPTTALLDAVEFRNAALARAVLAAGAKVDLPDQDGITALGWAAIGCETPVARILIEHGADVNHVDKKGMTPLLYAASVDFGDSSMIDLLLKSGANPKARTPQGLTASQLAKKYGHKQVMKSISATGIE